MQGARPVCSILWARPGTPDARAVEALDPAERRRAAGFAREADRDRFLTGALLLRHAAAEQLGIAAAAVAITRRCRWCGGPHGKPMLPGGWHASITHCSDLVGVALTSLAPVGLDAEQLSGADHRALLADVLAPGEPTPLAGREFLRCWTQKESALKATGDGLTRSMTTVRIDAAHRVSGLGTVARTYDLRPRTHSAGDVIAALTVLSSEPIEIVEAHRSPVAA